MGEPREGPREGQAPTRSILQGAYNQTYLIRAVDSSRDSGSNSKDAESDDEDIEESEYEERRVLFRCGNWCYTGHVTLETAKITLNELPRVVPALQRQQNRLHFYCNASAIPRESSFKEPLAYLAAAADFVAAELAADHVHRELEKWSEVYTWMESDSQNTYFELVATPPPCMAGISLAASKTYARGIVFITVYFEGSLYVVIQDGEGDQPLLDVKFPDVSQPGQGVHLVNYAQSDDGKSKMVDAQKLTLWRSMESSAAEVSQPVRGAPLVAAVKTSDLSTDGYIQMYTILKANADDERGLSESNNSHHDVLFRFGSWCYSGSVQLTPIIDLADLPHLIPALRVQQSRLDFVCDASAMPNHSPFSKPMKYLSSVTPMLEAELSNAEEVLQKLLEQFASMEVGGSLKSWLDSSDSNGSFFEFQLTLDKEMERAFRNVELVASKTYTPTGVVLIAIYFNSTIYVVLSESSGEQPLLDSRFPDVSHKGRGYLVANHAEGLKHWPQLRKVSIWQTAAAMKTELQRTMMAAASSNSEAKAPSPAAASSSRAPSPAEAPAAKESAGEAKRRGPSSPGGSPFSLEAQAVHDPQFQAKREVDRKETEEAKRSEATNVPAEPKLKNPLLAQLNPLDNRPGKVNAPHRVPAMQGLGDKLSTLRLASGDAPWDEFGRPKALSFKK